MEENNSGVLEELAWEVGDASGPLGARCDVIGGRDESAIGVSYGVLRQGGMRVLRRVFERQYPLSLAAYRT